MVQNANHYNGGWQEMILTASRNLLTPSSWSDPIAPLDPYAKSTHIAHGAATPTWQDLFHTFGTFGVWLGGVFLYQVCFGYNHKNHNKSELLHHGDVLALSYCYPFDLNVRHTLSILIIMHHSESCVFIESAPYTCDLGIKEVPYQKTAAEMAPHICRGNMDGHGIYHTLIRYRSMTSY